MSEPSKIERRAIIARYTLNAVIDDLDEEILERDEYVTEALMNKWYALVAMRKPTDPMLQLWYCDEFDSRLMATTNQPFKLE